MSVSWLTILRKVWALAPLILAGVIVLLIWWRPSPGAPGAPGSEVLVVGKAALTPAADDWRPETSECPPLAGAPAGARFRVVTREPSGAELERLARQYAARFQPSSPVAQGVGASTPPEAPGGSSQAAGAPLSRLFGEYWAPRMKYGGTYLAGLTEAGELQETFDPLPPPRFGWVGSWGGGAFVDLTSNSPGSELEASRSQSRAYVFLEPFQTKLVYWRIEGGAKGGPAGWKPYFGLGAEFRTDGWHLKNAHGIKAVRVN